MGQVFIFGASAAYGVGGEHGGWADMIKLRLHKAMFEPGGMGEKHEVYIFAKPGATAEFVARTFEGQLDEYRRKDKVVAVISVGGNNAKAVGMADNFVSTPEAYSDAMKQLLGSIKKNVDALICVGFTPVDEAKTAPKHNPETGDSFFWNKRIQEFNAVFGDVAKELGVAFVNLSVNELEWKQKYVAVDGLHPNDAGHHLICDRVWPEVEKALF